MSTCELCGHHGPAVGPAPLNWTRRICSDGAACNARRGILPARHADGCSNPFCDGESDCTAPQENHRA